MSPVKIARRFATAGLVLLTLVALMVSWVAISQLRDTAYHEAEARAHLIAEEVADQIQLAINVGVPVDHLEGVEDLFHQRTQSFSAIVRIALVDQQGRILKENGVTETDTLPLVVIPVTHQGASVASLELLWRQPRVSALLLPWGLPVAVLIALIAGLANEALRFSLTGAVLRRERLVMECCERIATGDLATRPPRVSRKNFDRRLPWLVEQLRHVSEQHLRVLRLAQSLRQTEPDFEKRHSLDRVLAETIGGDRFELTAPAAGADIEPAAHPPADADADADVQAILSKRVPELSSETAHLVAAPLLSAQAARQRWRGVMLGLFASAPMAALPGYPLALTAAGGLALLAVLLGISYRFNWLNNTVYARYGLVLGSAVFGLGFGLLAQIAGAPRVFQLWDSLGYALLALCGILALLLPLLGPRAPVSAHPSEGARHAA
ncbi:hypothetical protein [Ottowia thiooxydans]|uniref:Uncharacterized protein n=1 Tax=Ottowia thiooxydans TaxID=219182 RepID=A0ABV2QGF3_9BURK